MDVIFPGRLMLLLGLGVLVGLIVLIVKRPMTGLAVFGVLVLLTLVGYVSVRSQSQSVIVPEEQLTAVIPQTQTLALSVEAAVATTQMGKDWLDDWMKFVNSSTGRRWMRAESSLCATQHEAESEAIAAAVRLLVPYVQQELNAELPQWQRFVADHWLPQQIKNSLLRGTAIRDRHLQRIQRPYGDLWVQMLLIDASPSVVQKTLVEPYRRQIQSQLGGWRTQTLTLAVLVGVIVLLYAFLNAATKGYFVWRLRAASLLVLIVAVLVVITLS